MVLQVCSMTETCLCDHSVLMSAAFDSMIKFIGLVSTCQKVIGLTLVAAAALDSW